MRFNRRRSTLDISVCEKTTELRDSADGAEQVARLVDEGEILEALDAPNPSGTGWTLVAITGCPRRRSGQRSGTQTGRSSCAPKLRARLAERNDACLV